ncbi:hypothetical protein QE357_000770 [Siphonobacter sp. BAB-5404]|nr:hypothetical protein [Siphonobacter sp. SORGH_AS_1065]MDR6193718.1 hypothetical protein [Siphonobacter sp. SORGH_AS_0500]
MDTAETQKVVIIQGKNILLGYMPKTKEVSEDYGANP